MDDLIVALRMIVALAAVLGLLLFLSRRLQKGVAKDGNPLAGLLPKKVRALTALLPSRPVGVRSRPQPEKITVVARSGLGGKAQLVVAEFGGIRYVLGVTEQGVSVVDTQEAPSAAEDADDTERSAVDGTLGDDTERQLKSVA